MLLALAQINTSPGATPLQAVPLRLDGQAGAHEIAAGAEVEITHGRHGTAWIDAERRRAAHVEVLIFDAKDHVDQRAPVHHVVEAAARIPPAVARRAVAGGTGSVAEVGDGRAMGVLEIGRRPAAGGEDHQPIPGIAEARADGEQVGDLVFAEHVRLEALGNGQDAAGASAFVEATAQRRFHAHDPSAPLPLRARVEAEDGVAVVGGDVRRDRARRGENVRDIVPGAAGIEAKVSPGPVVIRHRLLKGGLDRHIRCHGGRRGHRRERDTSRSGTAS